MWDVQHLRVQHNKLLRDLGAQMDRSAQQIGGRAVSIAQNTTTITNRTGAGRGGWKYRTSKVRNGAQVDVTNKVRHMYYQEHGTGVFGPKRAPYVIRPRRGKFLRFVASGGQVVFARQVTHYGVHPRLIGRAAVFGRQAPFYGVDHSSNISTITRELQNATR